MRPEEQRIAIAKFCGYERGPGGWRYCGDGLGINEIPDYPNDLNAMNQAESFLTTSQRVEYCRELGFIWTGRNDRAIPNWWFVHDASPKIRAEALLRTIGKWTD